MRFSRKRLRPLDPDEERALHITDPLHVTLLDDERSYCFSWPNAPLTKWIKSNPAYAEAYVFKSAAAAAAAVAAAGAGATASTPSGWSHAAGGAASSSGTASSAAIAAPSVFSVHSLLFHGVGHPQRSSGEKEENADGGESLPEAEKDPNTWRKRGRGNKGLLPPEGAPGTTVGGAAAATTTMPAGFGSFSACEDLHRLLAPFALGQGQQRGGKEECGARIAMSLPDAAVPRVTAHPRSPPRPLCTGEDSIFSLNESQVRDAVALGLITCTPPEEALCKEDGQATHERVSAAPKAEGLHDETRGAAALKAAAPTQSAEAYAVVDVAKRRRLEWEVVDLEWRAFKESQRTASALQRLLSLEAAVPFEPHPPHMSSSGRTKDALPAGGSVLPVTEDWRRMVYQLWLHWRVGEARADPHAVAAMAQGGRGVKEDSREGGSQQKILRSSGVAAPATPEAAPHLSPVGHASSALTAVRGPQSPGPPPPLWQQRHRHLWGPPLMPGAYLYDVQLDYFLNPARTSAMATGAASGAPPGSGPRGGRDLDGLSPFASARRRRGPYSFLSWKVELYTPRLQQLLASGNAAAEEGAAEDSGSGGGRAQRGQRRGRSDEEGAVSQLTLEHPAFAPIPTRRQRQQRDRGDNDGDGGGGGGGGQRSAAGGSSLLNAQAVEVLLRQVVLSRPLVEVEQDGESVQDRLRTLEWADLKRDTEMWRTWLSKV